MGLEMTGASRKKRRLTFRHLHLDFDVGHLVLGLLVADGGARLSAPVGLAPGFEVAGMLWPKAQSAFP